MNSSAQAIYAANFTFTNFPLSNSLWNACVEKIGGLISVSSMESVCIAV